MTSPSLPLRAELAHRISTARRAAGLTRTRLCALSGVGHSSLRGIEHAHRAGRIETLIAVCDALGIDLGDLVAGLPDVRDPAMRELWRRAA